jgi:hypothetical protein
MNLFYRDEKEAYLKEMVPDYKLSVSTSAI